MTANITRTSRMIYPIISSSSKSKLSNPGTGTSGSGTGTANLSSQELLFSGGFVRQSTSGIFTLLPLGLRVLEKIEKLIDNEMKACGGQKVRFVEFYNLCFVEFYNFSYFRYHAFN